MIKHHSPLATPVLLLALQLVCAPAGLGSVSASTAAGADTQDQTVANAPTQPAAAGISQGKTVLLDVPEIAERVNQVVVNVRSLSEAGENLGSGFIVDQRGLIATNFHLISNSEPRRGR